MNRTDPNPPISRPLSVLVAGGLVGVALFGLWAAWTGELL